MGAGKSTVGAVLAKELALPSVDLDDVIVEREGRTAKEIIEYNGVAPFRLSETAALRTAISKYSPVVLALGGGAWTIAENRALMAEHGISIWLDVPFAICWERIEPTRHLRPFIRSREETEQLYNSRREIYGLADICIAITPNESPEYIASEIIESLADCSIKRSQRGMTRSQ